MTAPIDDDILDLLTAYALGALGPDEIAQVGQLLAERPDLRATLAELRATADQLPHALAQPEPPADLRQRVLDRAVGRAAPRPGLAPAAPRRRLGAWQGALGALAAVALLAAVVGWAQLFRARGELASAQAQIGALQAEVAQAQRVLASLQGSGGSGAILQTRSGATLLVAQLPPLSSGRVYQLWRIQGSSPPASAGTFFVDGRGFGRSTLPPGQQPLPGETVAVTDEPAGGSPGPTTKPLIVGTSSA